MKTIQDKAIVENYHEKILEFFKEFSTDDLYQTWAETFDVESVDNKSVLVHYHGTEDIKRFAKTCKVPLLLAIYSVLGEGKKVKITGKEPRHAQNVKIKTNMKALKLFVVGMVFVCLAAATALVAGNYIGNRNFRETFYNTSSIKVDSRVRVILLSDMHGVSYGKNNAVLLERIRVLEPDLIICTGDIVDSAINDVAYATALGQQLSQIAPSYYVYGNHELDEIYDVPLTEEALDEKFGFDQTNRDEAALTALSDPFEEQLEAAGFVVLKNEKDTIQVKTMNVDVYGVLNSNPSSFWSYSEKAFLGYLNENTDNLKITAVHEPFIFEEFKPEFWGDLMVCGHTHGGLMRVPLLGPLFTLEGGLFPERGGHFVHGRYDVAGTPLIVSAGLENADILRINNQPELVVIDINKF